MVAYCLDEHDRKYVNYQHEQQQCPKQGFERVEDRLHQCAESHHETEDSQKLDHLEQASQTDDSEGFHAGYSCDAAELAAWEENFHEIHNDIPERRCYYDKVKASP
mmetsp:Transcript_51973/g.116601  ORF Transcript_51973/g.116601 Transcript_51973/m.116601 type:complete len:106 (-) Transcript_51973:857-1174(-)